MRRLVNVAGSVLPVISMLAFLVLPAGVARANLITNGSFENTNGLPITLAGLDLQAGDTTIPGWTVTGPFDLLWIPNGGYGLTPRDGQFLLDLTGFTNISPNAGVKQTFATTPGQTYNVSFYLGYGGSFGGGCCENGPVFLTAYIDGGSVGSFTTGAPSITTIWTLESFDFTASGTSTELKFQGVDPYLGQDLVHAFIGLDNVSVDAASANTPEPSSVLLLGTGLAALVGIGKRRAFRQK